MVARFVRVELLASNARSKRCNQRADFLRRQHLVKTCAFHVQNFAPERQDRLKLAVAALLGRATGGVSLDQKQLGLGRVTLLAIRQLARQGSDVEHAFAAGKFTGLAGGFARGGGLNHLANNQLGFGRVLFKPRGKRLVENALDHGPHLGGYQLVLGLAGEFGVRHLDGDDGR